MKEEKYWRLSVSLTTEQEKEIVNLRMNERFTRMSYSEIIRMLIDEGIESIKTDETKTA